MAEEKNVEKGEKSQLVGVEENVDSFGRIKGIAAVFTVVLLTVASITSCQLLRRRIPDFELNSIRSVTSFLFFCLFLIFKKKIPTLTKDEILPSLFFGTMQSGATLLLFIGVTLMPVSTYECIFATSSILVGLFIFTIFSSEKLTVVKVLLSLCSVCGVILVIQPNFMSLEPKSFSNYSKNNTNLETRPEQNGGHVSPIAYLLGVFNGVLFIGKVFLSTRKYVFLSENPFRTGWYSSMLAITMSITCMLIFESPKMVENWEDLSLVLIHCLTFGIAFPLIIYAPKYISGTTFSVIYFSTVAFLLISQYTVLSHILPGHKNWMEVLGVALVFFGCAMSSVVEVVKSK